MEPETDSSAPAESLFSSDTLAGLQAAMDDALRGVHIAPSDASSAQAARDACTRLSRAVEASNAGRYDEARREIDDALEGSRDLRLLYLGYQFHFRRADYVAAERLIHRRLEIAHPDSADAARAWNNLGLISFMCHDLDHAEALFRRALAIDEGCGCQEGVARDLGNLSLIPEARGDLVEAERLNRQALEIAERIGALPIVATRLCNLGEIMLAQGRRDEARRSLQAAEAAFRSLGIEKHRAHCARLIATIDGPGP